MEKMTNVKAIDYVLANYEIPAEVVEKFEKMRASFVKKATGERKPTATQTENVALRNDIVAFLANGEKHTISELAKLVPTLAEKEATNQKVSALVRGLVTDGILVREEIKRKAYFSLA